MVLANRNSEDYQGEMEPLRKGGDYSTATDNICKSNACHRCTRCNLGMCDRDMCKHCLISCGSVVYHQNGGTAYNAAAAAAADAAVEAAANYDNNNNNDKNNGGTDYNYQQKI